MAFEALRKEFPEEASERPDECNLVTSNILEGRASNTRSTYYHAFNQWKKWAVYKDCSYLPANKFMLASYLAHLIHTDQTFPKIHGIYYAIKYYHRIGGFEDPCNSNMVKHLYDAAKRRCRKNFNRKRPFEIQDMRKLHQHITAKQDLHHVRLWTMCILMYSGFLRFDEVCRCRLQDVRFGKDHMGLFIAESKGDIYRDGDEVPISVTEGELCPVVALSKYIKVAGITKNESFLFRAIQKNKYREHLRNVNKPISYSTIRSSVLAAVKEAGMDPSRVGLHSFRAGGATMAANNGVDDRLFKRHGRWRSERAKDGYVRDNLERRLSVSRALGL